MARQKVETILKKIDRFDLLEKFKPSQDFVWDDTLIPYTRHQLPKDKLEYEGRFVEEQKKYLRETSQQIQAILEPADRGDPPHLRVVDISKNLDFGDELGEGTYGTVFKAQMPPSHGGNVKAPSKMFAVKRFEKCRGPDMKSSLEEFKTE